MTAEILSMTALARRLPRPIKTKGATGARATDADYLLAWWGRLMAKTVVDANGCWIFQGNRSVKGYGAMYHRDFGGNSLHRVIYQVLHGVRLTYHQFVCHRCDVKPCCNPNHLFLGDNSANQFDAGAKGLHQESRRTECPHGHPYDEANTMVIIRRDGGRSRGCRECARIRGRRRYAIKMGKVL